MPRDRRVALLAVTLCLLALTGGIGLMASTSTREAPTPNQPNAPSDETLSRLYEAGATGSNVSVGVVDVTGFATEHDALDGRVAAVGGSRSVARLSGVDTRIAGRIGVDRR